MAPPKNPLGRMQRGMRSNKSGDVYDYTYYDTLTLSSTSQATRMFTSPLGGAKTLADTNMKIGAQVANGKRLVCKFLKFDYISTSLKDNAALQAFYDFLDQTTLQVIIDGKEDYGTWRLTELMGAHIYFAMVPTVAGDNVEGLTNIVTGVYALNKKIIFPSLQVFEILVRHHTLTNAALNGDRFVVGLNGILASLN